MIRRSSSLNDTAAAGPTRTRPRLATAVMKTSKIENYDYSRARPHHPKPRQNRCFRTAALANRMGSHWQGVSAAGGERSVGGGRQRTRRCAPAHRRRQAPGARRRGSAQRATRLPAPPAAPQATQTAVDRAPARAARPERERSGVGDGVEHHQSISSCSCVPAEDRWAPGRNPAHQREHDPRRMSRASRGPYRDSQVAHTTAGEQTGEFLRLKVPPGYIYAHLDRHATPVLPAITGDRGSFGGDSVSGASISSVPRPTRRRVAAGTCASTNPDEIGCGAS